MQFPWEQPKKPPLTPYELMVQRLSEGVPPELAATAAGIAWDTIKDKPEIVMAVANGQILLFERARDNGVTGVIRAAMRYETNSWTPKAEPTGTESLEDLLRG